jgi:acetyl-CoA carboxylase alpha subunit
MENIGGIYQESARWRSGALSRDLIQALNQVPQLKEFVEIVQERGDDAQKLAEDTYKEIKQVLEKKLEEAKKLSKK